MAICLLAAMQSWCSPNYDTTIVTPSGHTLYLKIIWGAPSSIRIVAPNVTTSGEVNWDGYTKPAGNLVIPDNTMLVPGYGRFGYTVYYDASIGSIDHIAFKDCNELTSITMNSSMEYIRDSAFFNCTNLRKVTFGESFSSIGNYAFFKDYALDSLVFLGYTPPTLGNSQNIRASNGTYFSVLPFAYNPSLRFIVPCGSYNNYYNWPVYNNYYTPGLIDSNRLYLWEPLKQRIISEEAPYPYGAPTVLVNDNNMGSAVAYSVNCYDSNFVLKAYTKDHYNFVRWSNGSTVNPDTMRLTSDSVITAYFMPEQYTLTVISGEPNMGTVEIVGHNSTSGTFSYGDTVHFYGIANEHYHNTFLNWAIPGGNSGNLYSENGKDTAHWWVGMDANYTMTLHFAIDTHTVTVAVNDSLRGMVEASGSRFTYGSPCRLTATAFAGYTFHSWSNGVTDNPYNFAVQEDMNLTAIFLAPGEIQYTVTVTSANPQMGTVSGGGTFEPGATTAITANPFNGYHFDHWSDNNTQNPRNITVNSDITLTAYFAQNEGIESIMMDEMYVYASGMSIIIPDTKNNYIRVYSVDGHLTAAVDHPADPTIIPVPSPGVYLVKIGGYPAIKVVVIGD